MNIKCDVSTIPLSYGTTTNTCTSINYNQEVNQIVSAWNKVFSSPPVDKNKPKPIQSPYNIKKIEEIVPNKVYKFIFADDKIEKTVKLDWEEHNLKYAAFVALSKKLFKETLTFEGILYKIESELKFSKEYNKMIDKAIKNFIKEKKQKELEEQKTKEEKERKKAKALKKHKKRLQTKNQKNEELIQIITKAINNKES